MTPYTGLVQAVLNELKGTLASVNASDLTTLRQALIAAQRIYIVGIGRSGLQMRGLPYA